MWRAVTVVALVASCIAGGATVASAASAATCRAAVRTYAHDQSNVRARRAAITRCGSVTAWVRAVRATSVGHERTDLATTKARARTSLQRACRGNEDLAPCRSLASATADPALVALCKSAHRAFAKGQAIPGAESESILVQQMAVLGTSPEAQQLLQSLRAQPPDQQGDYGLVFVVAPLVKTCNGKGL